MCPGPSRSYHHCTPGSIILGLEGDSFPDIVDRIVDQMVADEQLPQDRVDTVQQALYKRHR